MGLYSVHVISSDVRLLNSVFFLLNKSQVAFSEKPRLKIIHFQAAKLENLIRP